MRYVWRFQCDPSGQDDPMVSVFVGTTTMDGEEEIKTNHLNAIDIPWSEFKDMKLSDATSVAALFEKRAQKKRDEEDKIVAVAAKKETP